MIKRLFRNFSNFSKDYYKILGVPRTASKADIRNAYLKLAKQYHPDSPTGSDEKFKELGEAWSVLGNETTKSEYDSGGPEQNYSKKRSTSNEYYYQTNDHQRWQYFYQQQYKANTDFQKDFERYFKNQGKSKRTGSKKTEYYEYMDPITGKRYIYHFHTYEDPNLNTKTYKYQERSSFNNKQGNEANDIFSSASLIFAGGILLSLIISLFSSRRQVYYQDRNPMNQNMNQKIWEEFEEEFNKEFNKRNK